MAQHRPNESYQPLDDALVQLEESAQQVPTRGDLARVENKSDRNRGIAIAVAILIGLASLGYNFFNTTQIAETAAESQLNRESIETLRLVREQLRESGVPEAELPPPVEENTGGGVDLNAIVQATAAIVLADIRTDPRYRGPIGPDGLPCDPERDLRCIGPEGPEGAPGEPGSDSPCVDNVALCQGPMGDPGSAGPAGADAPRPVRAFFERPANGSRTSCDYVTEYSDGTLIRAATNTVLCN